MHGCTENSVSALLPEWSVEKGHADTREARSPLETRNHSKVAAVRELQKGRSSCTALATAPNIKIG